MQLWGGSHKLQDLDRLTLAVVAPVARRKPMKGQHSVATLFMHVPPHPKSFLSHTCITLSGVETSGILPVIFPIVFWVKQRRCVLSEHQQSLGRLIDRQGAIDSRTI